MDQALEVTMNLGGTWHGKYGTAPCPICQPDRHKGQTALTLTNGQGGRLLAYCKKSGCTFADIAATAGLREGDYAPPDPATLARREAERRAKAVKRGAQAERLWRDAQTIAGTPAEAYLQGRSITCPFPSALQFHGVECPAPNREIVGPLK